MPKMIQIESPHAATNHYTFYLREIIYYGFFFVVTLMNLNFELPENIWSP